MGWPNRRGGFGKFRNPFNLLLTKTRLGFQQHPPRDTSFIHICATVFSGTWYMPGDCWIYLGQNTCPLNGYLVWFLITIGGWMCGRAHRQPRLGVKPGLTYSFLVIQFLTGYQFPVTKITNLIVERGMRSSRPAFVVWVEEFADRKTRLECFRMLNDDWLAQEKPHFDRPLSDQWLMGHQWVQVKSYLLLIQG